MPTPAQPTSIPYHTVPSSAQAGKRTNKQTPSPSRETSRADMRTVLTAAAEAGNAGNAVEVDVVG